MHNLERVSDSAATEANFHRSTEHGPGSLLRKPMLMLTSMASSSIRPRRPFQRPRQGVRASPDAGDFWAGALPATADSTDAPAGKHGHSWLCWMSASTSAMCSAQAGNTTSAAKPCTVRPSARSVGSTVRASGSESR